LGNAPVLVYLSPLRKTSERSIGLSSAAPVPSERSSKRV
jgi:hypothetical protein